MNRIIVLAALLAGLYASPAAAKDNFTSLDEVDDGNTESLDSVDDAQTEDFDSVDDGRTESLDSKDDARTESLGSADTGRTESLDSVDTGQTYGLDEAKLGTIPDVPKPVAQGEFDGPLADVWKSRLSLAYREVKREGDRYREADRAHVTMLRTGYPTGEARVEIERNYAEAGRALKEANVRYSELVERAKQAAR